jgi:hypothetical protein
MTSRSVPLGSIKIENHIYKKGQTRLYHRRLAARQLKNFKKIIECIEKRPGRFQRIPMVVPDRQGRVSTTISRSAENKKYAKQINSGLVCEVAFECPSYMILKLYNFGMSDIVPLENKDISFGELLKMGVGMGSGRLSPDPLAEKLSTWLEPNEDLHYINVADFGDTIVIRLEVENKNRIPDDNPYPVKSIKAALGNAVDLFSYAGRHTSYSMKVADFEIQSADAMRSAAGHYHAALSGFYSTTIHTSEKPNLDYAILTRASLGLRGEKIPYAVVLSHLRTPGSVLARYGLFGSPVKDIQPPRVPKDPRGRKTRPPIMRRGDDLVVTTGWPIDVALVPICWVAATIVYMTLRWGRTEAEQIVQTAVLLLLTGATSSTLIYLAVVRSGWAVSDVVRRRRVVPAGPIPNKVLLLKGKELLRELLDSGAWRGTVGGTNSCLFDGGVGDGCNYYLQDAVRLNDLLECGVQCRLNIRGEMCLFDQKGRISTRVLTRTNSTMLHAGPVSESEIVGRCTCTVAALNKAGRREEKAPETESRGNCTGVETQYGRYIMYVGCKEGIDDPESTNRRAAVDGERQRGGRMVSF